MGLGSIWSTLEGVWLGSLPVLIEDLFVRGAVFADLLAQRGRGPHEVLGGGAQHVSGLPQQVLAGIVREILRVRPALPDS